MTYTSIEQYRKQLTSLNDDVDQLTVETLNKQESELTSMLQEISESIKTLGNENDFIVLPENSDNIDYTSLSGQINEFNGLLSQLRKVYLEQESLDQFLRYTLSSPNTLQLANEDDPKMVNLKNQIKILYEDHINEKEKDIVGLKTEIIELSNAIARDQLEVNEICLKISSDIDDSFQLLNELSMLQDDKIADEELAKKKNDIYPFQMTIDTWVSLENLRFESKKLEERIELIKSKEQRDETVEINRKNINIEVLQSILNIQRNKLLVQENITELNLTSDVLNFTLNDLYKIEINLTPIRSLYDIKIHDLQDNRLTELESDIKKTYFNERRFYVIIRYIKERLNNI